LSRVPKPTFLMAACLAVLRAGLKAILFALRTPRGTDTTACLAV
jgi:hypothetical protein